MSSISRQASLPNETNVANTNTNNNNNDNDNIVIEATSSPNAQKMNGLTLSELCCLFCCPPCPARIAAKLAFLPPEPTYTIIPDDNHSSKLTLKFSERADWQYTQRELECFEVQYAQSSRGNRIACKLLMHAHCF